MQAYFFQWHVVSTLSLTYITQLMLLLSTRTVLAWTF